MNEKDFISEFFPFLRRKVFWFIIMLLFFIGLAFFVRGLISNRLPGGHARILGAYGPTTAEGGFDLKAVGFAPIERFSNLEYSKIIGEHFEDVSTGENFSVFAIKHEVSKRDFVILFNVFKIRNIFTSEEDKEYGGDVVLTPVALISWDDFVLFESGKIIFSEIKPTGFPKGCKFKTFLGGGMTLEHQYISSRQCHDKATLMSIRGGIRRKNQKLFVNMIIRDGQNEYSFGEKGQVEKSYQYFGAPKVAIEGNVP